MKIEGEGQLLRVFIGEGDRWEGQPLYEAIVRRARADGLLAEEPIGSWRLDPFPERLEGHLEPLPLQKLLVSIRFGDRNEASTDGTYEEIRSADEPMFADSFSSFPPEAALLIGGHGPTVTLGEHQAGSFAAPEARDEVREEFHVLRMLDRAGLESPGIQGAIELRSLIGPRDFSQDVIWDHKAEARQVGAEPEPGRMDQVDEDVRVGNYGGLCVRGHVSTSETSALWARPASSSREPRRSREKPSIDASSSSLPCEISSRRNASSAKPRILCWNCWRTSA